MSTCPEKKYYPPNLDRYKKRIFVDTSGHPSIQPPVWMDYYDVHKDPRFPSVLLTYQIHPDEDHAKHAVREALDKVIHQKGMPNVLFVPVGSPTGVLRHSTYNNFHDEKAHAIDAWRDTTANFDEQQFYEHYPHLRRNTNGVGNNLNWCFEDASDPEVATWKTLLNGRSFDYSLHLHHDYAMEQGFYAYLHTHPDAPHPVDWNSFLGAMARIGHTPYTNEYDDLINPALGTWIPQNGLIVSHPDSSFEGNFEQYLLTSGIVKKGAFTFELPNGLRNSRYGEMMSTIYSGLLNRKTGFVR